MLIHLELPHRYEVEGVPGSAATGDPEAYSFCPANAASSDRDVQLLRFRPQNSASWVGTFASGNVDKTAPSMVLSTPDPLTVFVVAAGDGYSVRVDAPRNWQMLPVSPVLFAEVLPERTMVVLGSASALAVYDPKGLCWFRRVVDNELKLQSIAAGRITFSGLDRANGKSVRLSAELNTGKEIA
jgi:hypothetical protein